MRRALGKGLAQLMGEESEGTVHELPISAIFASPSQPRQSFDEEETEELAQSLREHGVLQPILVRPIGHDRYEIMAGERRFRAAQKAGLSTVPVVVKPADAQRALEYGLIENVQRVDIAPLEAATAYRRLVTEFGLTQDAVAGRVGKSRVAIANTLRLLGLPAEVQDLLATGAITEGHARAVLTAESEARMVWVARRAAEQGLSVRQTEALARGQGTATRLPSPAPDPDWERIADRISERLGTRVRLKRGKKRGKLEIDFESVEDLERVLEAIGISPDEMP